ncbi:hypothetical protein Tco_0022238, partial [Tanacetum coccineum]
PSGTHSKRNLPPMYWLLLWLLVDYGNIFQLRDGWLWRINVMTNKVIHTVETDIVKHVVEIESFDMSSGEFDKETVSVDELQLRQVDLSCIHALNELHLHEIHVVPIKHEADQC